MKLLDLNSGTHFSISFIEYPEPDDIYSISYNSPFLSTDTLFINANAPDTINVSNHNLIINEIKVVPNPYVGTNLMEEAFSNPNQNQERKIMFTIFLQIAKLKFLQLAVF